MSMSNDEREFWDRVTGYEARFRQRDYQGAAVAIALALRRESGDVFAELGDNADLASDTDDTVDYVRWLQRAEEDVANRISQATALTLTDEAAETHIAYAYAILREVCRDALSRRPSEF